MKKRNTLLALLLILLLAASACHHHRYQIHTLHINDDNSNVNIEYCGDVYFNDAGTDIEDMAPGSYITCKKGDCGVTAKCKEDGEIKFKVTIGGKRIRINDEFAGECIARAIKEMALHYER